MDIFLFCKILLYCLVPSIIEICFSGGVTVQREVYKWMKGAAWKDEKGENTFTEELFDFLLFLVVL